MYLRSLSLLAAFLGALAPLRAAETMLVAQPDYVLQPYDMIRVVVFQEPDLGQEVRHRPTQPSRCP